MKGDRHGTASMWSESEPRIERITASRHSGFSLCRIFRSLHRQAGRYHPLTLARGNGNCLCDRRLSGTVKYPRQYTESCRVRSNYCASRNIVFRRYHFPAASTVQAILPNCLSAFIIVPHGNTGKQRQHRNPPYPLHNPPHRNNIPVSGGSDLDACPLRAGMYDLSVSYVDPHVSAVVNHIARFCLRVGYPCAHGRLCIRTSWQGYTIFFEDRHHKSGTIRTVGQAGTARHIGITDKLTGKVRNLLTLSAATGGRRF